MKNDYDGTQWRSKTTGEKVFLKNLRKGWVYFTTDKHSSLFTMTLADFKVRYVREE